MRTALITGVSGQDGIHLARALLAEGTRVVGLARSRSPREARYLSSYPGFTFVACDLRDRAGVEAILDAHEPDEIYNLAALSSVGRSWAEPEEAAAINGEAVAGLLDAVLARAARGVGSGAGTPPRFVQASSAEVGPGVAPGPSPYAQAKARADRAVREARERHGLHASIAYLHNHESPLRSTAFVTRKLTRHVAGLVEGFLDPELEPLTLGTLDVARDWGHAGDHVEALRLLQRADEPADVEIGTGRLRTLRDVVEAAFAAGGIDDPWPLVDLDPGLGRPHDRAALVADPEPAARLLGWRATRTMEQTMAAMVAVDRMRWTSGVEDDPAYLA